MFMEFMLQDQHVDDLNTLDQHYVGNFVDLMRSELSKNDGKLRAALRARDPKDRGIAGDTLNRHLASGRDRR